MCVCVEVRVRTCACLYIRMPASIGTGWCVVRVYARGCVRCCARVRVRAIVLSLRASVYMLVLSCMCVRACVRARAYNTFLG